MLRVGLTGGLGSGKSTAALLFAQYGAYVLQADEIARDLMQPGEAVYNAIVHRFGRGVVQQDGQLDRQALAKIAFADGRVEELNAIVHPATIAEQAAIMTEIAEEEPAAIIIVESALLFETKHGAAAGGDPDAPWRSRFDCIVLVTANDETKIERYIQRVCGDTPPTPERRQELEAEARRRLAQQIPDAEKESMSDFILPNDGTLEELEELVEELWEMLDFAARNTP
ncbi:MAG: dephospho-CoA kinase [Edaphobacter sp.]|uniref:dephospho-CoA kinase n=1 Tax=Edaphobacter sp. TaxID=1934404 RepID=UPI00239B8B67|nr:dephospho-CoA kinase [Edaphobacter sp.]MDE1176947.1 dephospho-CoA kinase [Edaphobacter sp.]